MSSASLASIAVHAHRELPDRVHIAALSAAIALNLAVLVAASRPLPPLAVLPTPSARALPIHWVEPPPVVPLPPLLDVKPLPLNPPPLVHSRPKPVPMTAPAAMPTEQGRLATPPLVAPTIAPTLPATSTATATATPAPVEATLAYRSAPLTFPVQAIRQHLHGTVLLRVLVDEQGKPIQVLVERSSGHAVLDRSAREQVLAAWRFEPAHVGGKRLRAWARVPVTFALHEL